MVILVRGFLFLVTTASKGFIHIRYVFLCFAASLTSLFRVPLNLGSFLYRPGLFRLVFPPWCPSSCASPFLQAVYVFGSQVLLSWFAGRGFRCLIEGFFFVEFAVGCMSSWTTSSRRLLFS